MQLVLKLDGVKLETLHVSPRWFMKPRHWPLRPEAASRRLHGQPLPPDPKGMIGDGFESECWNDQYGQMDSNGVYSKS